MLSECSTLPACDDARGDYCMFAPCACKCHVKPPCQACADRDFDDLTANEGFEIVIDDSLPRYAYNDGTGDECTYHERIEYAGEELRELRREVRHLRDDRDANAPIIAAALAFHASTHTRDANCRAGDHDTCTRPAAERALDAAVAAYLGGGR